MGMRRRSRPNECLELAVPRPLGDGRFAILHRHAWQLLRVHLELKLSIPNAYPYPSP
jgi:hypothetical protein